MRDKYLTLSGISASGTAGSQSILSTASTWANTPFDTGLQQSSLYGQSPFIATGLNNVPAAIGQAPKKFFFLVTVATAASGGTAANSWVIALMNSATSGGSNTVVLQTAAMLYATLTAAAYPNLMLKLALPEPLKRYIYGKFTVITHVAKFKVNVELTEY